MDREDGSGSDYLDLFCRHHYSFLQKLVRLVSYLPGTRERAAVFTFDLLFEVQVPRPWAEGKKKLDSTRR